MSQRTQQKGMYRLVGGGKCVRDSVSGTSVSGSEMLLCDVPGGSGGKTERDAEAKCLLICFH